ncbi:MAG: GNAT family N-acetyltransferase [Leptospiraceae bacterium]|nr:GNAT family N-acetyltransferase [Leptospiraceae bacterium]MCB1322075.1 GNAT family N-acetyltransferase [Leptospiraceae bacterium]
MKVLVKYADLPDLIWLKDNDRLIDSDLLRVKIIRGELIIAQQESKILGWLRYGFFWDSIPFMNMLFVATAMRGKGIGRRLVEFWEGEMKDKKHKLVMTSAQSNEDSQFFYRRMGYIESGSFKLPGEHMEIIFSKDIE